MPIFRQRDTVNFIVQILQTFGFCKVFSKNYLIFTSSQSLQVEGYFFGRFNKFSIFEKFFQKYTSFLPSPVPYK